MEILYEGIGELFMDPDPDLHREFFRNKNKAMVPKVMTAKEAVSKFIHDGDYIAVGAFGGVRIPVAILHEIVRQGKKHLGFAGHTATHDCQILVAGECFDRCDIAYVIGLEARGLSPAARRYFESGKVKVTEWTNAALAWRFKAAAMGVPFLVGRNMLGTDTLKYSASKVIRCPYTGKPLVTFPALYPDVAIIHVHEADVYGNCRIRGSLVADYDLARASKRVIISCERIIPEEEIRREPEKTIIPYWCVDAVVEQPFGSYPGNMPYEYFSDEEHLKEWLEVEKDPEQYKEFIRKNILEVKDFNEYLELHGGIEKMQKLRLLELNIRGSENKG